MFGLNYDKSSKKAGYLFGSVFRDYYSAILKHGLQRFAVYGVNTTEDLTTNGNKELCLEGDTKHQAIKWIQ